MESQTLGRLTNDPDLDVFRSSPIVVRALQNLKCTFVFDDLDDEAKLPDEFDIAVKNFMALPENWRVCLSEHLWEYYQDIVDSIGPENVPAISRQAIVDKIEIDSDITVTWDYDENDVYVSLESECDWEIEHGLQITLRNGNELAKVGPCDGHVTNADAYDRDDFKGVIYVKNDML